MSVMLYNSNPRFLHLFLKRSFGNAIRIFLEKFYFLAANGYICIVCRHWFDLRTDVLLWRTEYVVPDRNTEL